MPDSKIWTAADAEVLRRDARRVERMRMEDEEVTPLVSVLAAIRDYAASRSARSPEWEAVYHAANYSLPGGQGRRTDLALAALRSPEPPGDPR